MITVKYQKDDFVCRAGDQADCFYIIKEGSLCVMKDGKEMTKME